MNVLDTVYTLQNTVEIVGVLICRKWEVENVTQGIKGIGDVICRTDGFIGIWCVGTTGITMADLNEDSTDEADNSSSTQKEQVYTSLSPGNKAWLDNLADRKDVSTSDALRKLVHNARTRDKLEDEELII